MFTNKETTSSSSQLLSIPREGGREETLKGRGGNLTARYSTIAIVTFACKAVFGIVWDADSFVTARIYVVGFAEILLKKTKKQKNNRYIPRKK